ncbi:MAG TPA: LuxR C-terminal-related transcriptional regulator, partial [Chloroflexota bacterium]
TSRVALHLRWEHTLRVPPLALPDLNLLPPLDELLQIPSVALFVARARTQRADFRLTPDQAAVVARLVARLDGVPLAIELAAARTSVLPLVVIAERLHDRLQLLKWDAGDLPARQRSLNATMSWSYELLSASEQHLFRHLGVFVGRVSLAAIVAVLGDDDEDTVLAGMVSLAEQSLILPEWSEAEAEPAFGMLETVRKYAWKLLERAGELEAARDAHAGYYLGLAERAEPELTGREQQLWFERLEKANDNLQAALRRLLDNDESERALRLATALGYFWMSRGYIAEGQRQLEEALMKAPSADPLLRARALSRLVSVLIWSSDDLEHLRAILTEALELARAVQDTVTIARSLTWLGLFGLYAEDWNQSRRHLEEALTHCEAAQDEWGAAHVLGYLGAIELGQGHCREARRLLEDSVARFREIGEVIFRGAALMRLAYAAGELGDIPGAMTYLRELHLLSTGAQARRLLHLCALGVVGLLREQGNAEYLARLLGALQQLGETMGVARGAMMWRASYTGGALSKTTEALHARLDEDAFQAALTEGRFLSFQQMTELIGELLAGEVQSDAPEKTAQELRGSTVLSPREQEVLRLVAEGLTSKQVGTRLFLSHRTVDHHLTSIYNKLGVDTRAQAVAVAARDRLV